MFFCCDLAYCSRSLCRVDCYCLKVCCELIIPEHNMTYEVHMIEDVESTCFLLFVGLSITKGNVQAVLKRSQVSDCKGWLKTLRCFGFATADIGEDLSPTEKIQYVSEAYLEKEKNCDWWRLGIKLIRCCQMNDIERVQELMLNVAIYNHKSKSSTKSLSTHFSFLLVIWLSSLYLQRDF